MPEYDKSYYDSYLAPLYETNSSIYEVDKFLFNLTKKDDNGSLIKTEPIFIKNFNKISNITFSSENISEANTRAEQVYTNSGDAIFTSSQTIPLNNDPTLTILTNSATLEYVNVTINKNSDVNIPASTLMYAINAASGTIGVDGTNKKLNTSNNLKMHEYMRGLFLEPSKLFMKNAVIKQNEIANDQSNYYLEARYYLGQLSNSKFEILFHDLETAVKKTIYNIINAKVTQNINYNKTETDQSKRKYISENFIRNLLNLRGPLYYKLRNEAINNFRVSSSYFNVDDKKEIISYFKMIAIDLYIKTSYNLVVYDYISSITTIYTNFGDFVNSRIGLLAKVMYTYLFIDNIKNDLIYNTSGGGNTLNSTNKENLNTILSNLKDYLIKMNEISSATALPKMIVNLHNKSNEVVDKNKSVQTLNNEIKSNQLGMRNIIYNTGNLRSQYKNKMIELIILSLLLIIVITVSSILIFLETPTNNFRSYVLYLTGFIALIILIFELAKIISYVVKKS